MRAPGEKSAGLSSNWGKGNPGRGDHNHQPPYHQVKTDPQMEWGEEVHFGIISMRSKR